MCNGESSIGGSDIAPCFESIERENPSDEVKAHSSKEKEPQSESSWKGTDFLHGVESMKGDSRRLTSSVHYLDEGEFEGSPSAVIAEHEACFPRRKRRLAARKVPMSMARKICAFSKAKSFRSGE